MRYSSRMDRLRSTLASSELDALLVTDDVNVRYLSGFTGDSTAVLVTADQAWILSDRRYEEQIARECPGWNAMIRGPERRMHQWIGDAVRDSGIQVLGLEDHATSWSTLNALRAELEPRRLEPTSGWVAGLRCIKDGAETDLIRRAIHCAERAFGVLRASLRPGMTELEAAYRLESAVREFGGQGVGFDSIIATGPAGALPHYRPGRSEISGSAPLLIDWGARVDGYTSDMTRTLSIGTVTAKMREVYPIVLEAHLAAIDQIRPGVELKRVDAAAREVIRRAGYGEAFAHGLGHGIGMEVHEAPRLASNEEGTLAAGMVVTVEPGIYLPGELGVRIEDDVLVTPTGFEVLCSLPKGLEENVAIL